MNDWCNVVQAYKYPLNHIYFDNEFKWTDWWVLTKTWNNLTDLFIFLWTPVLNIYWNNSKLRPLFIPYDTATLFVFLQKRVYFFGINLILFSSDKDIISLCPQYITIPGIHHGFLHSPRYKNYYICLAGFCRDTKGEQVDFGS